jgi:hypothetical protein
MFHKEIGCMLIVLKSTRTTHNSMPDFLCYSTSLHCMKERVSSMPSKAPCTQATNCGTTVLSSRCVQ